MAEITLNNVTKRWGGFYAVDNMDLHIGDNAFVTLLGPSGCGKTTTLRMIAGLETPTSGRICIDGEPVFDSELGINVPPNKRKVGFLFQNYALWPNMTVYKNISFGLQNIKEEMPDFDGEASKLSSVVEILKDPENLVENIKSGIDKTGKLDEKRIIQKLVDAYKISRYTAKQLYDYKLHNDSDMVSKAKNLLSDAQSKLDGIISKHKAEGISLNENFELVKDGEVQKSVRKLTKEEIDQRVNRVSRIVKIGMFMDRYPSELSGGQQQRVAIARTLAPDPKVLFMDEPLSNLDAKLRLEMRSELQRLHLETGSTFIYVTHDQIEAMSLATKICLMDNGLVQQHDEPLKLYNRPNNIFCADFVGNPSINFVEAKLVKAETKSVMLDIFDGISAEFIPNNDFDLEKFKAQDKIDQAAFDKLEAQKKVEKANKNIKFKYQISLVDDSITPENEGEDALLLGIRPEFLRINEGEGIKGEVFSAMPTGMETTVRVRIGNYLLTGVVFGDVIYKLGEIITLSFSSANIMLFHKNSGKIIDTGRLELR